MLDRVEQAQKNIEIARATHGGNLSGVEQTGIGMISRMGGRMIHYYSDDLTDLLLDDILADTVRELQANEQKARTQVKTTESKELAENLLMHIAEYQNEEHVVSQKWTQDKQVERPQIDLGFDAQPKTVKFEGDEFGEVSQSGYQNPFESNAGLSMNAQMIIENDNIDK